jgi:urea transport system ATP-binding protein
MVTEAMVEEVIIDSALVIPPLAPEATNETVLRVNNVRVSYGDSVVVDGATLEVKAGQVICLMGRNGAGKTTLMKAIMGILPQRSGEIDLFGENARRWPSYKRARSGVGYVPQGRGIFPYLTVMDNILVGTESTTGSYDDKLDEVLTAFPVLKQMAGRTAGLLSGGQQQQLAIARALMGNPKLLLLDEPAEGIQPNIVQEIEEFIAGLRGKMSVLLVEQFLDFAFGVADHCYVMESGRMVIDGPPSTLDKALLQQYLAV